VSTLPICLLRGSLVFAAIGFSMAPCSAFADGETTARQTENVLLISIDGVRWQEVFRGAEERLLAGDQGKIKDVEKTRRDFWRDSPEERRASLMPFVWSVIAREGQLFGNRDRQSTATLLNDQHFSYPGYQELLCGYPDARITSNDKLPNPNITVLEWLARKPTMGGRVAAFCSWDTFPAILNAQRSGLTVNAGWQRLEIAENDRELAAYNRLIDELPRVWNGVRYDAFTAFGAREHLKVKRPRLLYLALGEPDDWAHEGRYDLYLEATQTCDRLIAELWQIAQSIPEYRGKTTLVLAVDHGRGRQGDGWQNHKVSIPGSDEVWIGVLGPDTPPLGERAAVAVTQGQIAATVAALLGYDYAAAIAEAGAPLPDVLPAVTP
jgi:hypothetical protein